MGTSSSRANSFIICIGSGGGAGGAAADGAAGGRGAGAEAAEGVGTLAAGSRRLKGFSGPSMKWRSSPLGNWPAKCPVALRAETL